MKLIPLGVNGYLPLNGRHTSCFLVLYQDAAFLLDAGTGAARLHEPKMKALLEKYKTWEQLLSIIFRAITLTSLTNLVSSAAILQTNLIKSSEKLSSANLSFLAN